MSTDVISVITGLFANTMNMLNGVYYPGTRWTILGLMLMMVSAVILIAFLRGLFGLGMDFKSASRSFGSGGNSKNIKISKERKNDTK